jgi:hypothetical protein
MGLQMENSATPQRNTLLRTCCASERECCDIVAQHRNTRNTRNTPQQEQQ